MKKFLLAALAFTTTSFATGLNDDDMNLLWGAWKNAHSKSYAEAEEPHRLKVFTQNYNKVTAHNAAGTSTVTLGLNKFADLTADEFKSQYLSGFIPSTKSADSTEGRRLRGDGSDNRVLTSLPTSVDWRTKGALTPVKNQVHCGGCWSFSTTGALEALHYIKTGTLLSFSEQQLLDCNKESDGCAGGNFMNGITYSAEYGNELESEYPFVQKDTACTYSSKKAYKVNTGRTDVKANDATALMTAIVSQPVSIAIQADQSTFQLYKSGVVTSGCGSDTDHAVLAVGYTTIDSHQAFIVKNSWGAEWGQEGYVYISTSSTANSGKGVCGILSEAAYPTV